jgi:dTDP-4-amino-4,6-dideoxygalactose transaminase
MHLGSQGDAELFSFHATKPFGAGEGGMVATRDNDLAARLKQLTNFGLDQDRIVCDEPGLNAKLSELHAATALAVLDHYSDILGARRRTATGIRSALEPHGFRFQEGAERSTWQFVPVLAPTRETRRRLLEQALRVGIEVKTYFQPLHRFPAYRAYEHADDLPVTDALAERTLSLPLANNMDPQDVQRIQTLAVEAATV